MIMDGYDIFLWFCVFCFVADIAMIAYFDWASRHLDRVPEWVRVQLVRER